MQTGPSSSMHHLQLLLDRTVLPPQLLQVALDLLPPLIFYLALLLFECAGAQIFLTETDSRHLL